jgi:hypothetical protein
MKEKFVRKFAIGRCLGDNVRSVIYIDRFKLYSPRKYSKFQKIVAGLLFGWKIYDKEEIYVQQKNFQRFVTKNRQKSGEK